MTDQHIFDLWVLVAYSVISVFTCVLIADAIGSSQAQAGDTLIAPQGMATLLVVIYMIFRAVGDD